MMYPRRMVPMWALVGALLILGATIVPVSSESDTSEGFFAHLWNSIFGSKEHAASNTTATGNETDAHRNSSSEAAISSTPLPKVTVVSTDKNEAQNTTEGVLGTTSSASSSTTSIIGVTGKNGSDASQESLSTTTANSLSSEGTTVGSNASTTVSQEVHTTTDANSSTLATSTGFHTDVGNTTAGATTITTTTTARSKTSA